MDELKKLREQQAKLVADARSRLEEITDDTPEERASELESQFDAFMAEVDELEKRCQRLEKLQAAQDAVNAPDPRRPLADVDGDERDDEVHPEYREVFAKMISYGVSSLDTAERNLLREHGQNIPGEFRAQGTGDAAGGYTVPQEFSGEIDVAMAAWGPMWDANIVRELNTSNGREIDWPTVDDTAATGRIKAENAAVDDDGSDDVTFGEKKLNAYIYDTGMVRVPIELLQDSAFDIEALMTELFGERLGRTANTALTTGTGSSQPQGIVPAAGAGVTAAATGAFTSDELIDVQHSVDPAYRASPRCRWMFNDTTLAAIRKLKDGQGNYLWQMGDVRVGEPATILGHPYSVNQACPNATTGQRPVVFGDFGRYVVRKVIGFTVLTLRERYAENFQVGMVGFKRFDGELLNSAAIKALTMA